MATNTYKEWHPHNGSVWQRVVSLWESYIGDSTVTLTITVVGEQSHWSVKMQLVGATDTNIYYIIDGDGYTVDAMKIRHFDTRPGWKTMPQLQPATQGGRTTLTDWHNNMIATRRQMWSSWTNSGIGTERLDNFNFNYDLSNGDLRYWTVKYDNVVLVDVTLCQVGTQTANEYLYAGQPICDGSDNPMYNVNAAAGGGSVDLAPLVAAVNEIANSDPLYSANNGANIFSMRSRVRTGP